MSVTRTLTRRRRLGAVFGPRAWARPRSPRGRLRVTPRMRLALVVVVLLAALLFGAWTWVRDSSLVGIDRVTISGATGPDATAIRSALRSSARNMTTLDVQTSRLRSAMAAFPEVKGLRVRTVFPHRLVIGVIEERPVALIDAGGRQVPVAGDGTILRSVTVTSTLPTIPLSVPPVGRRLKEGRAAEEVALLGAAPYQMLSKISQVTIVGGHGLVAELRNGPSLYFGQPTQLSAKWIAVTEVLADSGSAGASYIDVTDPSRPAAGAGSGSGSGATGTGAAGGSATGAATPSPTGGTAGPAIAAPTTPATAAAVGAPTGAGASAGSGSAASPGG